MQEIKNTEVSQPEIEQQLVELRKEIAEIEEQAVADPNDLTKFGFEVMTTKAAVRGYLRGLEAEEFPMGILPPDFAQKLESPDYSLPIDIWGEINTWEADRQARASYPVLSEIHRWRALRAVQLGEPPLGILKGREHLALKLELAGKFHFEQLARGSQPILYRFGLEKSSIEETLAVFYAERRRLHEKYNLGFYDNLVKLIGGFTNADWPKELCSPFAKDSELMFTAINQYAMHYF